MYVEGLGRIQNLCVSHPAFYRAQFLHYGTIAIIASYTSVYRFHVSSCFVVSRPRCCRVYSVKLGRRSHIKALSEGTPLCLHGGSSRRGRVRRGLARFWQWRRLRSAIISKKYASIGKAWLTFEHERASILLFLDVVHDFLVYLVNRSLCAVASCPTSLMHHRPYQGIDQGLSVCCARRLKCYGPRNTRRRHVAPPCRAPWRAVGGHFFLRPMIAH